MKKVLHSSFFLLLGVGLLFTSCQKEEQQFIDENEEETITVDSTLANLLMQTSQNNGSIDDIIDGNSCASLVFPVTIIANGQKIVINTIDDIALIEEIFSQFSNDTDAIEIIFPVTVVLSDFSQLIVNDANELQVLIDGCEGENSLDCVDLVYPITFFVYDATQEQTGTVVINNDVELYLFLIGLDADDFVSLDYPISLTVFNDTTEINSNQELFDSISNIDCNDLGSWNCTQFEDKLTTGVWYITYFFDAFDETGNYSNYELAFATNGSVQASDNTTTISGNWDALCNLQGIDMEFSGSASVFDKIFGEFEILEETETTIRFQFISNDGTVDYLTLDRTPNTNGTNEELNNFIETLTTDVWYLTLYDDNGIDATCDYVEYEFTYYTNGTVQAVNNTTTVNGFWTVESNNNVLDLVLNFDVSSSSDPFESFNDAWEVLIYDSQLICLEDVSSVSGAIDHVNFGRNPFIFCGATTIQELKDIVQEGQWYVGFYENNNNDETIDFIDYILSFNQNGTVAAMSSGSGTLYGTWDVTEDSGGLNFMLDFGTSVPLNNFNHDWDVLAGFIDQIVMEYSSGGEVDTLIFDKL